MVAEDPRGTKGKECQVAVQIVAGNEEFLVKNSLSSCKSRYMCRSVECGENVLLHDTQEHFIGGRKKRAIARMILLHMQFLLMWVNLVVLFYFIF